MSEAIIQLFSVVLLVMGVLLVLAVTGLLLLVRSIRRIRVPREADFFTTMHYVPLTLVVLLDMLDLSLDVFSAPVAWIILDRMGLPNLRNKATIEALIPATGPIPTFTIAWFLARVFGWGSQIPGTYYSTTRPPQRMLDNPYTAHVSPQRPRPPARIIDMDDR